LSICGGEAAGYVDVVAHPAAPTTSASRHARDSLMLISTSKASLGLHTKCHLYLVSVDIVTAVDDVAARIAAWGARSRAERLDRLRATPGELSLALDAAEPGTLARRPAADAWAPVEVVCHLRDLEESFHERLARIVGEHEPRFPATNPARWAVERQYLRQDARRAGDAFALRRAGTLELFSSLAPPVWVRAGYQMDSRGRRTVDDFLTVMAWHDENHLAQLRRALAGCA
jgi:hypothetical protein